MGYFKKKTDPVSGRAKVLNAEIAVLEEQIRKLTTDLDQPEPQPRPRSTAPPQAQPSPNSPFSANRDPIFEKVDQRRLKIENEAKEPLENRPGLGVAKFDPITAWKRFLDYFRGPPPTNPKLLNYLAAGSIQGLRPLRYEKRIARYRLLLLSLCLFFALWIIIYLIRRH
ncbi:MAG: hypothetical protein ABI651_02340 [Verrucomicrobiota bacterium]